MQFMLSLMEKYPGKVVQLGQKTVGMDAGALLGMPTVYIDDSVSEDDRMQKWVKGVPN